MKISAILIGLMISAPAMAGEFVYHGNCFLVENPSKRLDPRIKGFHKTIKLENGERVQLFTKDGYEYSVLFENTHFENNTNWPELTLEITAAGKPFSSTTSPLGHQLSTNVVLNPAQPAYSLACMSNIEFDWVCAPPVKQQQGK